jgi:hypothetical protein
MREVTVHHDLADNRIFLRYKNQDIMALYCPDPINMPIDARQKLYSDSFFVVVHCVPNVWHRSKIAHILQYEQVPGNMPIDSNWYLLDSYGKFHKVSDTMPLTQELL